MMDPMSDYILTMLAEAKLAEAREEVARDALARRVSAHGQRPARDVMRATGAGIAAATAIVLFAMINGR